METSRCSLMNNKSLSVALAYDLQSEAPLVIAKGKGDVSHKMLDIATFHGIEIVQDPNLAHILIESEIGACIPYETWTIVAKIFSVLEYGVKQKIIS